MTMSCDLQCSRDHTSAQYVCIALISELRDSELSAEDGLSSTCVVCRSKVLTAVQRREIYPCNAANRSIHNFFVKVVSPGYTFLPTAGAVSYFCRIYPDIIDIRLPFSYIYVLACHALVTRWPFILQSDWLTRKQDC